jgi:hypothetical protein
MSDLQTNLLYSFALVVLAGTCWGFTSRHLFHSVSRNENPTGFFGKESWLRKYKLDHIDRPIKAKRTFYTRLFNVKYKERFPLSSTLLVFLTDYYHAGQFLTIKALTLALALQTNNWLLTFIAASVLYHIGFHLTYYKR